MADGDQEISKVVLKVLNEEGDLIHRYSIKGSIADTDHKRIRFTGEVESAIFELREKYGKNVEIITSEETNYKPLEVSSRRVEY